MKKIIFLLCIIMVCISCSNNVSSDTAKKKEEPTVTEPTEAVDPVEPETPVEPEKPAEPEKKQTYTIVFKDKDENIITSQIVNEGDKIKELPCSSDGWSKVEFYYKDKDFTELFDLQTPVTESFDLFVEYTHNFKSRKITIAELEDYLKECTGDEPFYYVSLVDNPDRIRQSMSTIKTKLEAVNSKFYLDLSESNITNIRYLPNNAIGLFIPDTFEKFDEYCSGLENLNTIDFSELTRCFDKENGVLYSKDKKNLLYYPPEKIEDTFDMPDTLESIPGNALNNKNIKTMIIPASLKSVEIHAFDKLSNTTIDIYYEGTLKQWIEMKKGRNGDYYTVFSSHNLYINNSLVTDVVIPDTVTEISVRAFENCKSIETITIPASVTKMGYHAFINTKIKKTIYLGTITQWSQIDIYDDNYRGSSNPVQSSKNLYINNEPIKNIVIDEGTEYIRPIVFEYLISQIETVTIPSSVTRIGGLLFYQQYGSFDKTKLTIKDADKYYWYISSSNTWDEEAFFDDATFKEGIYSQKIEGKDLPQYIAGNQGALRGELIQ